MCHVRVTIQMLHSAVLLTSVYVSVLCLYCADYQLNSAAMDASVLVGANSNGQVFVFEPGHVCNVHSVTVQITAT
jgi:hypothetical protein